MPKFHKVKKVGDKYHVVPYINPVVPKGSKGHSTKAAALEKVKTLNKARIKKK